MAKQENLPGVPAPAKRKIIDSLEELGLDRDKVAGKRTALGDQIATINDKIQEELAERKLDLYTYEDNNGVLQDLVRETALRKRKSKLNPKKSKKADE